MSRKKAIALRMKGPVTNAPSDDGGVKHVAEIDRKDREDHQPRRDLLTEQLDADHLAGSTIDRAAHQHGLEDGEPVGHRESPEQKAEWKRRDDNRKTGARAAPELVQACLAGSFDVGA